MTDSSPDFRLGTACHEAGHAVVLHSLGVHVHCVRIEFTDDQWRGGTDAPQEAVNGLSDMDQVVTWIAGRAAEEFFKCPSYESAWWDDMKRVFEILLKAGVPEDKHRLLRAEAKKRARGTFLFGWVRRFARRGGTVTMVLEDTCYGPYSAPESFSRSRSLFWRFLDFDGLVTSAPLVGKP